MATIKSIKQKAKAYDKALEKARQLCAYPTSKPFISDLQDLFPELRESEDERMIKSMTRLVKAFYDCNFPTPEGFERKDMLAWLEKQGEKMSDLRYSILAKLIEADDIYQMSVNASMVKEAKNKAIEALSNLEISKLFGLEKQGEQKPAWSEEDEKLINRIEGWLDTLCDYLKDSSPECIEDVKDIVEQLKSPRLQNRWKPSERQISALEWQLKNTSEDSWQYIETEKLLEQLKKLREE